jgi:hypothetical protein
MGRDLMVILMYFIKALEMLLSRVFPTLTHGLSVLIWKLLNALGYDPAGK